MWNILNNGVSLPHNNLTVRTRQLQKTIITCLLQKCLPSKLQNTFQPSSLNSAPSKFLVLSLRSFTSMEYAHVHTHTHAHIHTHTHKYSHSFRHCCSCKSPDTIMVISFTSLPTHLTASPILHTSHSPG